MGEGLLSNAKAVKKTHLLRVKAHFLVQKAKPISKSKSSPFNARFSFKIYEFNHLDLSTFGVSATSKRVNQELF